MDELLLVRDMSDERDDLLHSRAFERAIEGYPIGCCHASIGSPFSKSDGSASEKYARGGQKGFTRPRLGRLQTGLTSSTKN